MKARFKININSRGGAVPAVLVLCAVMLILVASFLSTVSHEKTINHRSSLLGQARNGAESVAELALAQMAKQAVNLSSQSTNPLSGYTIPASEITFLSGGPTSGQIVASSIAYKAGDLSDRTNVATLIDSSDGVTGSDPDVGSTPMVRSCDIFGTVSVRDPLGSGLVTSYVAETVQMREKSWFNFAVFYNMDMEFHAGPNFDITGPVHTNGDAYVMEGAGSTLAAHSAFTTHKQIFRFIKYALPAHSDGGFTGTVNLSAGSSTLVSMATNQDSTTNGWLTFAQARWKYNVQDIAFGVPAFSPDNMPTYIPEDFSTSTIDLRNYAYLLIEPQLSNVVANPTLLKVGTVTSVTEVGYATGRYGIKDAENMKFSALSGFVIKVRPPDNTAGAVDPTTSSSGKFPHWYLVYYDTPASQPVGKYNLPSRNTTDGTPIEHIIDPFAPSTADVSTGAVLRWDLKQKLFRAIMSVPYQETGTAAVGNNPLQGIQFPFPAALFGTATPIITTGPGFSGLTSGGVSGSDKYYALYDRRQGYNYPTSGALNNGLQGAYNVLRIDLSELNNLLNDTTSGLWNNATTGVAMYSPALNYSGVVYVEFPLAPLQSYRFAAATPISDFIRRPYTRAENPATLASPINTYALVLTNAMTLPRLTSNLGLRDDGFTIATNGPAYILGNYNADGVSSTGSSTNSDTLVTPPAWGNEIPSLVAADSVTVLSAGFNFQHSSDTVNPGVDTTAGKSGLTSNFDEVSTAIITGLVPTHPGYNNVWSGGVHNFIRFLENWGGATYRYRGSLAALFESESAIGEYHEGYNPFYGAPTRAMGYHQFLSQGWFPPGTPIKRTVRRMNFRDITKAQWDAGPIKGGGT